MSLLPTPPWTTPAPPRWFFARSLPEPARRLAGRPSARSSPCSRARWSTGLRLIEQGHLAVGLRTPESRQPNPNQAHRPRLDVRPPQRRPRRAKDRLGVVGRARPTHLAAPK